MILSIIVIAMIVCIQCCIWKLENSSAAWFSPHFTRVQEIKRRSAGLHSKHLPAVSHLTSPCNLFLITRANTAAKPGKQPDQPSAQKMAPFIACACAYGMRWGSHVRLHSFAFISSFIMIKFCFNRQKGFKPLRPVFHKTFPSTGISAIIGAQATVRNFTRTSINSDTFRSVTLGHAHSD